MTLSAHKAAIDEAKALLGDRLSTGSSILEAHSHDEAYSTPSLPDAVAFVQSTEEVSKLMKICSRHKCPVVPYGVGTSLEGHVVPIRDGSLLTRV